VDAEGVEYFEIQAGGQSMRLFRCPSYRCDLSAQACAERFRLAQNLTDIAGVGHAAYLCKHCPIGAQHAGKSIKPRRSHQCLRCGSWSPKLVRGLVCVPCYNRQQEVLRGQDRRGHRPKAVVRFWDASPSKVLGQIPQVFVFCVEIDGLGVREFVAARPKEALEMASRLYFRGEPLAMKITNAAELGRQAPRYPVTPDTHKAA